MQSVKVFRLGHHDDLSSETPPPSPSTAVLLREGHDSCYTRLNDESSMDTAKQTGRHIFDDDPSVIEYDHESRSRGSLSEDYEEVSKDMAIEKLERFALEIYVDPLMAGRAPSTKQPERSFSHPLHSRMLTSMLAIADFCHELLLKNRTTTIREVYYHFVTYFRHQEECNRVIWELANALRVPRSALGLVASPKGWTCGCLELFDKQTGKLMWNGRHLDVHGIPITASLLDASVVSEDAKCIFVVEKEGIYTRLSEDKFFQQYPCILVCGKGFPDIATRKWVHHLADVLDLDVFGLCDSNPYGISVLNTYQYDEKVGSYGASMDVPRKLMSMKWIGLRPSQLDKLALPASVFQQQTDLDKKRLDSLLAETHMFQKEGNSAWRIREMKEMERSGRKVELEALNWLGMDFLTRWLKEMIELHDETVARGDEEEQAI